MQNTKIIMIVIFLFTIVLTGCDRSATEQPNGDLTANKSSNTPQKVNTLRDSSQNLLPKPTNRTEELDFNVSINTLNEILKNIVNKNISHDDRVSSNEKFLGHFLNYLKKYESTKLNDEELQKALNYNVYAKTNTQSLDGFKIRIIRFDGLAELFGTLERKWTYIQWWNHKEVNSQIILDKGAEVTDDFLISKVKDTPTVTLGGYLTSYKPFPVFISTWQLKNNIWERVNLFANKIDSSDIWNFNFTEKFLTIEGNSRKEVYIEFNQEKEMFRIYSEHDQSQKLDFKFQEGELLFQ